MKVMVDDKCLSQTISWLRFPLIVGIVLLHTFILNRPVGDVVFTAESHPAFATFEHIAKADFGEMAVPLFFFISGFLFFYRVEQWNRQTYLRKLKSRLRTLVVPYLLWNTVFLLYVALLGAVMPSLLTYKVSFLSMTPAEILNAYWELSLGLIPLWFIRDLMILCLLSFVVYGLLKPRFGSMVIILMAVLFISAKWHYLPGVGLRSSFPFMLGAWFSIQKHNFIGVLWCFRYVLLLAYLALVVIDTWLWSGGHSSFSVNRLCLLCGLLAAPLFVAEGLQRGWLCLRKWKEESSFFVYVFHMFIVHLPFVLLGRILPLNDFTAMTLQIAIPILVAYLCVAIYFILKKIMPGGMRIAVGGR